MKDKKNANVAEQPVLAKGIYKKRVWPWVFILASILLATAFVVFIPAEFFNTLECKNHICSSFLKYAAQYNIPIIIACAFVLVVVIIVIFSIRKRHLIVTATTLTFKKGRKVVELPINYIENIDTGSSSIMISIPYVKFKVAKLKNKKEIYDAITNQMKVGDVTKTATTQDPAPFSAKAISNAEGKLAYFRKLYDSNLISQEQYEKYCTQSLKTDSLI